MGDNKFISAHYKKVNLLYILIQTNSIIAGFLIFKLYFNTFTT